MTHINDIDIIRSQFEYDVSQLSDSEETSKQLLFLAYGYLADIKELERQKRKGGKANGITHNPQSKRTRKSNRDMNNKLSDFDLWRQEPSKQLLRSLVVAGRTSVQWFKRGY